MIHHKTKLFSAFLSILLLVGSVQAQQIKEPILSDAKAFAIGERVWKNHLAEQTRQEITNLEQKRLPHMLRGLSSTEAAHVTANFERIARAPGGYYALLDYMHFKGDGTKRNERYRGQGWGLLQVLETMSTSGPALPEFVKSAKIVLQQRINKAPAEKHESKWIPFWHTRLNSYLS